ncbi:MAG TPA: DUF2007 domain-containing protein [Thermoanaerobaculia bacterium]|nr:DUF2007 domain-containing protein [Thermoanaerobaculia bacterium]
MTDRLETVATFTNLTQAQSARSALESAEIESFLLDEATGSIDWGLMPAMGGLRLQVKSADATRAREALSGLGRPADPVDAEEMEHSEAARHRKRRVGLIALLIFFLPTLLAIVLSWLD